MNFSNLTDILTYLNSVVLALILVAGGWVKIRDYFKSRAQAKIDEAAAAAKAKADEIEAAVQDRLKKIQAENIAAPDSTSTSTGGTVNAV